MTLRPEFDVGPGGPTGYYSEMIGRLRSLTVPVIWTGLLCYYLLVWPFGPWPFAPGIFTISPHINVLGIGIVVLIAWIASYLQSFYWVGRRAHQWIQLELQGVKLAKQNGRHARIIRRWSNGNIDLDTTKGEHRAREEIDVLKHRGEALRGISISIATTSLVYVLLPLIFTYLFDLFGPDMRTFTETWNIEFWMKWAIFWFVLMPKIANVFWYGIEHFIYRAGSQYIPGARCEDALRYATEVDIGPRDAYDTDDIAEPGYAARQLSS